jgi:hypothetical protein
MFKQRALGAEFSDNRQIAEFALLSPFPIQVEKENEHQNRNDAQQPQIFAFVYLVHVK